VPPPKIFTLALRFATTMRAGDVTRAAYARAVSGWRVTSVTRHAGVVALTDEEQQQWRERMRGVMVRTRFIASLGTVVDEWSAEEVRLRIPFAEQLTNDGKEYHGGVIASLLDTTGASAVWAGHDFDRGLKASTVSMTVNYCGRAKGDLIGIGRCVRRGRDLHFAEMRVEDQHATLVATGTLVYRIVP
jgi:uncharacterized protein (TIGR00369 family)